MHPSITSRIARSGFTLIELLVVISIISILIALLLPAMATAREQSRRIQCANQLRSMGMASMMYDDVYRELPRSDTNSNAINHIHSTAQTALINTFGAGRWWKCPSQTWPGASATRTTYYYFGGNSGYDGGGTTPGPLSASTDKVNGWRKLRFPGMPYGWYPQLSISRPDPASKMPAFVGESYYNAPYSTPTNTTRPYGPNHAAPGTFRSDLTNFLFLDGHVAMIRPTSGESWRLGGDAYGTMYWHPPGIAPYTNATILP